MLDRGTGADLQRRMHADTGDLGAVVRMAVAVTSGQDDDAARAAVLATG
jgi:carboxylate-amine ligase